MRTRGVIAGLVVLITALACCGSAGARTSKPRTQTASAPIAGGATVSATLTYTPHGYYDTGIALSITRAGRNVLSERVDAKPCRSYCAVGAGKAVHVVDLAGSGEPEVFVDLYTGGAHCCSITRFFTYDAASDRYRASQHDWGDPGYRLKTLGGQAVFETADDRFAYAFTDFAGSGLPLELLRFNGAKLVDVTTQFPALIARDAAVWLRAFTDQARPHYSDTVGVIAAWAADEDELGHQAQVAAYLRRQAGAGHLNSGLPGARQGAKFVQSLDAFLKRTGYLKAPAPSL